MNRFLKKVLVYILCIGFISVVISVSVDPYNIYHYNDVRMNSGEMNSRYVKTKYILSHPDKFNSFLFGSSIVGFIHTEQLNDENMHWYNMTYPNGKLAEIKETIKTFIENDIIPENIMIGIDGADGDNERIHINDLLRKPYPTTLKDKIAFHYSYMTPAISIMALMELEQLKDPDLQKYRFYEYGGIYKEGVKSTDWGEWSAKNVVPETEVKEHIKKSLSVVEEICRICEENDINLILFTTPLYVGPYLDGLEQGHLIYIREIAKIHDIYSFSSINSINTNTLNYWEQTHYDKNVGDLVLKRIYHESEFDKTLIEEGFGVLVTEKNADEHYKFLMDQFKRIQGAEE